MFTTSPLKRFLIGGVVAAALLAAASPAAAETVLSDGHVDVGPIVVDGTWQLQARNDAVVPEQWLPLEEVTFQVPDSAQLSIPDTPDFAFLGTAGSPVWLLPQTQQTGLLWPGWNTQHESVRDDLDGPVTWSWDAIRGPGTLVLFLDGSFGAPEVMFTSAQPLPQQAAVDPNVHVHGNWAFSAPGRYEIDMTMAGSLDGESVSDTRTLAIQVGSALSASSAPTEVSPPGSPQAPAALSTGGSTGGSASVEDAPSTGATTTEVATPTSTTPRSDPSRDELADERGSAGTWWLVGSVAAVVIVAALVLVLVRRGRR